MKKVVVGTSGSRSTEEKRALAGYRRSYVAEDYVQAILENKAIPIILPMSKKLDLVADYIRQIDGLLLSGGHDVAPRFYAEEPLEKLGKICPERDEFELALIAEALKQRKPILGICRGQQILNVYFKGSLYQDQSYASGIRIKHDQDQDSDLVTHSIFIEQGATLAKIFAEDRLMVNSFHHQMVKELGQGLLVDALSGDGVVEAFHHADYPFVVGVQWHPEMLCQSLPEMNLLFQAFIKECSD